MDLGAPDQPRELKIGTSLSPNEMSRLIELLRSYLDSNITCPILPHARPIKQKLRRLHPRWSLQWLANVVPIPKKDGKVRVCVDFRDLNKASLKDDFPLPCIDMLVDSTAGHSMLSFMDGFSGYNKILMALEDMEKTSFITEWGTYCYRVMPFRLKNAWANYHRANTTLFHDMMHRDVEVYVDDMIVKSRDRTNHLCAFEKIKECLISSPVLVPPTPRRPLLLYYHYYLSKRMLEYEYRYIMIERLCLALVWATRRLRHYVTEYSILLVSRLDPLRYLFDRPVLIGRLTRWLVLLIEFDIQYVTHKSAKRSIVADHLASLLVSDDRPVDDVFPDEQFVSVTSISGFGIGILLISPQGDHIPRSVRLAFSNHHRLMNNVVEYEACITGLETALDRGVRQLEIHGDSNLVIQQTQDIWRTRDEKLKPYHAYLDLLTRSALAYCCLIGDIEDQDGLPWYHDIYQFLSCGAYPESATIKDRRILRQLATRFVICGESLYRRSPDGLLLLCLDRVSADQVIREVHAGVCGLHMGGHMLARKIMRTGYFWLTMEADCCQFVQRCLECQMHGDLIHMPLSELHALTSPWPFSVWGIDIIGKISPKSFSGHEYILVAIDYFTKWVEAASYAKLTAAKVAKFIKSHIIYRYGVPHELISDRGAHFRGEVDTLVQECGIQHHRSSAEAPFRAMGLSHFFLYLYWSYALLLGVWRLRATNHVQAYQRKMTCAFRKMVKPRKFQKGDLVLKRQVQNELERVVCYMRFDPRGSCLVDRSRRKSVFGASQCGSAKEVLHMRSWSDDGWPSF
uniref:Integrase catalytic domain-containing protein n=1 Tax=Vitis vinifera TaxID=29760 RepID=A5BPJ6_VITVI|nr:hypothetical protein VITISV_039104 [Vitis vinifera]